MNVVEALAEWFAGHHERGGEFSQPALEAAGYAARSALRKGSSFAEAFEVGRTTFFSHLDQEKLPVSGSTPRAS